MDTCFDAGINTRKHRHRHRHRHTWDATVDVERGVFVGTVIQKKLWGDMTDCPGTPDSPIHIREHILYRTHSMLAP